MAKANPRRRRRRHRRHSFFAANRPHRRRRYRRNPLFGRSRRNPPPIRSLGNDLLWGTAGLVATKFASNTLTPMVGSSITAQPIMRIAWNLAMAYVAAWGLAAIGDDKDFTPAFIGGSMIAAQDFVTNYVSPLIPQLTGYNRMGLYYQDPRMAQLPGPPGRMGLYYRNGSGAAARHDAVS